MSATLIASGTIAGLRGPSGATAEDVQPLVDQAVSAKTDAQAAAAAAAASAGAVPALQAALTKLQPAQIIGRPDGTALVDGSVPGAATSFIMADAFAVDGPLEEIDFFAHAAGAVYPEIWENDGGTLNRVSRGAPIAISGAGSKVLNSTHFGTIDGLAGQFPALNGTILSYTPGGTSDGAGYRAIAGANPTTGEFGAATTVNVLQIRYRQSAPVQVVTADAFESVQGSASALNAPTQLRIGKQSAPITTALTLGATATSFILSDPVPYDTVLQELDVAANAAGNINIEVWTPDGANLDIKSRRTVTALDAGRKIFSTVHFDTINLSKGDRYALNAPGVVAYTSGAADPTPYYTAVGSAPTTTTPGEPTTANRLEAAFKFIAPGQAVTVEAVAPVTVPKFLQGLIVGYQAPFIAADGNSITCGVKGVTSWANLLNDDLGISIPNAGVPGQTTLQMTADAATQIDPLATAAIAAGQVPILLVQELYNDMAQHSFSASQAVANMATYIAARLAAGWQHVLVFNLADMNPSGGFTSTSRVDINNALDTYMATADPGVHLIDTRPVAAFNDRTNTTYYLADKVHPTDEASRLYEGLARRVLRTVMFGL